MIALCTFIGSTVGGYAGWALGAAFGFFPAFVVSMVGTGVGMFYGRKVGKHYAP